VKNRDLERLLKSSSMIRVLQWFSKFNDHEESDEKNLTMKNLKKRKRSMKKFQRGRERI
jgi:hypothetical protein